MATQIQLADGGYLETYSGSDGRLHVQKYTAGGTPIGADHALPYESPQIAALSDGGFVVTRSFYAYGWNTDVYVFSPESVQQATFGTAGAKLLASPEGGFALASTRTEYRGDGDGPETMVTLYSNAGVKVFEEGPFLGESGGLTLLETGDYRYSGVTIDPSSPRDAANPSTPKLTVIDDVEPQGSTVNDPTPTLRVAVTEEGRLQFSGSLYHSDPYNSKTVTAEDAARGYVDIPVNGGDGAHSYRVRMIDTEGLVSSYANISYNVDTTPPGAPVVVRVMDNQGPVEGQVPAGGTTDDISPTLHLTTPGGKLWDYIQLYKDGQMFGGPVALTVADVDRGYVAITPNVAPGSHSFSAQMTDTASNKGAMGPSFSFTVQSQQQPTSLSVSGAGSKPEGDTGATAFVFNVTRSGDVSQTTAVDYFLLGDPADFTGRTTSTLTFLPGEQAKTIEILVSGDTTVEPDETFEVGLSNPRGAVIGVQKAQGVIQNDDGAQPADRQPSIVPGGLSVDELSLSSGGASDTDLIRLTAADGVDDFKVEGRPVITDGVFSPISFTTPLGATLAFTAYDEATTTLTVSYKLTAGIDHTGGEIGFPNVRQKSDRLSLELTDRDGDYVRSLLNATVNDDLPTARNDSDTVVVGEAPATGNVITDVAPGDTGDSDDGADRAGADVPLRVTAVRNGPVEDTSWDANGDLVSIGRFGTLSIKADGSYSYVLNTNPENGVTDSFGYTVMDADGSVSGASLSIQVQGGQQPPTDSTPRIAPGEPTAGGAQFSEQYLPNGTTPDASKLSHSGRVTIASPDGYKSIVVGGHEVVKDGAFAASSYTTAAGQKFAFTAFNAATGELSYTYTLQAATTQQQSGGGTPTSSDRPMIVVTDNDGDVAQNLFIFAVQDDKPIYAADHTSIAAGSASPLTGNLLANDKPGADGWSSFNVLHASSTASAADAQGYKTLQGTYGVLRFNGEGDYSYTVNASAAAGAVDRFSYAAPDADGSRHPGPSGMPFEITITAGSSGSSGQAIRADQPGDTLAGGSGADTLYASQGPDQLTGGGGADHFAFEALPWRAGVVTDFADGSDKIDLRALYQASGYMGADAVADRYVTFESDGAGGTKVMYDTDGAGTAQAWSFHITTLQGVAPSALSNADLVGGSTGGGNETQPGGEPGAGQVLTSSKPGDTLAGGAGNDTLNASQGPDQLTGAGGADRFVFAKPPWSAGVITDFAAGSDKIDVAALLDAYTGSNPLADGWMRLDNAGGSTKVYVDIDGAGGEWPFLITTLQGVPPSSVSLSDFVV